MVIYWSIHKLLKEKINILQDFLIQAYMHWRVSWSVLDEGNLKFLALFRRDIIECFKVIGFIVYLMKDGGTSGQYIEAGLFKLLDIYWVEICLIIIDQIFNQPPV